MKSAVLASLQKWSRLRYSATEVFVGNKMRRNAFEGYGNPEEDIAPCENEFGIGVCVFWLESIHLQLSLSLASKKHPRLASRPRRRRLLGLPG